MDDLYAIFPVSTGGNIPWAVIEPHRDRACANFGLSLEELARGGGLSWREIFLVLTERPSCDWNEIPSIKHAYDEVQKIIKEHRKSG